MYKPTDLSTYYGNYPCRIVAITNETEYSADDNTVVDNDEHHRKFMKANPLFIKPTLITFRLVLHEILKYMNSPISYNSYL